MRDLPEPKRPPLSYLDEAERKWTLLVTAFSAATIYTLLHKLIIPVVLKGTSLRTSPYAKVDWWFLYALLFLVLLKKEKKLTPVLCILSGAGIVYGAYEIYETALGLNPGWLAFSRLLSSLPIAGLCIAFMTQRQYGRRLDLAWVGATGCSMFLLALHLISPLTPKKPMETPERSASRSVIPSARECGAESLTLVPEEFESLPVTQSLTYDSCGFFPSRILLKDNHFNLVNKTSEAANFHMVIQKEGKLYTLWNILVPANLELKAPPFTLQEGSIAMIYSDNRPAAGVTAIVKRIFVDHWYLARNPLTLKATP